MRKLKARAQLHKGIGGSGTFIIYAVWESTAQLKKAMLLYYLLYYFICRFVAANVCQVLASS